METSELQALLKYEISFILAPIITFGIFWLAIVRAKAKSERLEVRPPLQRKLRRPAGHSLRQRQSDLWEKTVFCLIQSILVAFVVILLLNAVFIGGTQPSLASLVWENGVRWIFSNITRAINVLLTFTVLLASPLYFGWCLRRAFLFLKDARYARYGLNGELAVAEVLSDATGYRAYHDIPGAPYGNIDHVAVGYGGIYVIETKYRSKRAAPLGKESYKVECNGKELRFPNGVDNRAIPQAQANARWLQKEIRERTGLALSVLPLVVIPGWFVEMNYSPVDNDVRVLNDTQLGVFLKKQDPYLNGTELTQISRIIIDKVSDVEF